MKIYLFNPRAELFLPLGKSCPIAVTSLAKIKEVDKPAQSHSSTRSWRGRGEGSWEKEERHAGEGERGKIVDWSRRVRTVLRRGEGWCGQD